MPSTKPVALGPKPEPAGGGAADRVRAGDERIGAVIDIEQHALRAFEQDPRACLAHFVAGASTPAGRIAARKARFRAGRRAALAVDRRLAEAGAQRVMMRAKPVELRLERVEMGEVAHADRAAADLVLIGRADAAPGRADLALARRSFAQADRDRGGSAGSAGNCRRCAKLSARDRDALPFELLDLGLAAPRDRAPRHCR